jgi:hypothetical protein
MKVLIIKKKVNEEKEMEIFEFESTYINLLFSKEWLKRFFNSDVQLIQMFDDKNEYLEPVRDILDCGQDINFKYEIYIKSDVLNQFISFETVCDVKNETIEIKNYVHKIIDNFKEIQDLKEVINNG